MKTGLLRCKIGKTGVTDLEYILLVTNRDFQPSAPSTCAAARMRAEMEVYGKAIAAADGLGRTHRL